MTDKNLLVITPHRKEPGKQRIAAYCRVSSRSDEQLNSLANQIDFYRSRFENDNTALFVGIYAEEGLSGTQAENRPQFMKMIEDCRNGLIDCIWTKSVSRFGRNTVDTLIYIRELRTLGIDVFFEKENIHSTESSGELMLTLMAAFAESESETMSANIKWGKRRRYEQGITGSITLNGMYGFRQNKGVVTVVEDEAELVRRIYKDFIDGYSYGEIADRLIADEVPTRMPGASWAKTTVQHIIRNEKYCGDALMQKTYTKDFRTHKSVKNTDLNMYFKENHHTAIIKKEDWIKVQKLLSERHSTAKRATLRRLSNHFVAYRVKDGLFKGYLIMDSRWSFMERQEFMKIVDEAQNTMK